MWLKRGCAYIGGDYREGRLYIDTSNKLLDTSLKTHFKTLKINMEIVGNFYNEFNQFKSRNIWINNTLTAKKKILNDKKTQ